MRFLCLCLCLAAVAGCGGETGINPASGKPHLLRLRTTTSLDNSGLTREILPWFEKRYGVTVHVVAVGSGAALDLGKNGDDDVLIVPDAVPVTR